MRFVTCVATLIAVCIAPLDAQPPRAAHGTYAVWICPQGCALADTASATVTGFLVLSPSPLALDSLSPEIRRRSSFMLDPGEPATACFNLVQRVRGSSFAGIIPRGATTWTQRGDTVSVLLYASPDASYRLFAVADGDRLAGPGRQSGFIGKEFNDPGGGVHGVRVGPADSRWCQAVVE